MKTKESDGYNFAVFFGGISECLYMENELCSQR